MAKDGGRGVVHALARHSGTTRDARVVKERAPEPRAPLALPWRTHLQLEQLLRRRRVLAPLLRTLRGIGVVPPTTFVPALTVLVGVQRHPEYPEAVGNFGRRVEAMRLHLQQAEWGAPFHRRDVADLASQLEGLCASALIDEHDDALAYWATAALRWAVRTERPIEGMLLNALMRLQGADEHVDALIAHASRDGRAWLAAMQHFGLAVHKTGPLARRLT